MDNKQKEVPKKKEFYGNEYYQDVSKKEGYNLCHDEFTAWVEQQCDKIEKCLLDTCEKELNETIGFMFTENETRIFAQAIKTMILGGEGK